MSFLRQGVARGIHASIAGETTFSRWNGMKIQNGKALTANGFSGIVTGMLLAFLLLLSPLAVHAQNYSGTVRGTVTDPSGAAVVGATVSLHDVGNNSTVQTTTGDQGEYTFASVNVGVYELRVKLGSFKEFLAKNVEVHVSNVTEINAKLELGASSDIVTVEASDIQVQTTTAEVGGVVEGTQVRELPLNGRNFIELTQLQPGVSAANSFDSKDKGLLGGADFSVNGNPNTNNLFLIDGVNNNDVGSNRTILIYPSVDSIAEFKMLTNSYGPEYGQASGAIISITTRSGENQFHGGAFYEGRNDALDANTFFDNRDQLAKPELRRNDFGYYIGGPVKKDKLFFWWNEEWNKQISGSPVSSCVPTAAEASGDFTQGISCNAGTPVFPAAVASEITGGTVNPDGSVTGGKITNPDAAGSLLAAFYPLPNRTTLVPGTDFNWATNINSNVPWREENARIDYNISKKNVATFRYTQDSWKYPAPNNAFGWGDAIFPTLEGSWNQPSKSIMGRLTSTISNSLINDVEYGYAHNAIITTAAGTNAGLPVALAAVMPTEWPETAKLATGFPTLWGGLMQYGNFQNIWLISPYGNHMDLNTLQDNLSKVHGNHIFKFGAYYTSNVKDENQYGGADRSTFGAAGGWGSTITTGNSLANILLPGTGANPQEFTGVGETNINPTDHARWHDFEVYAADTWKISRNVTINYGFRWSFLREPYSAINNVASFSLADWSASEAAAHPNDACNGVVIVPGTSPCTTAAATLASEGVFLPLSAGTPGVNRALVANNNHDIAPRLGVAWDIFGNGKTALRVGVGQFYQRERVSPQLGLSDSAPFAIGASVNRPLDSAVSLAGASTSPSDGKSPRGVTPNTWQWNVSIERQLARNTSLQIGYIGNAGIHLTSTYDLNQVLPGDRVDAAFLSGSGGTTVNLNSLRPADNFGSINYFSRDGHSSYHALQAQFKAKLSNFSTFQAAYTWSHTIANVEEDNSSGGASQGSFTDLNNLGADKGNTTINRPQIFVANEVFFLPKLEHKATFVRETLGGWELNTIFTAEDGNSVSVFTNGIGDINNGGATTQFCNVNGTPTTCYLQSLSGTGYGNNQRPNIVSGTTCNSGTSGVQVFNPAAFTVVGYVIGDIGNAPRGYCHGPHYVDGDIQISKNWQVREHLRIKFSLDAFNAFNHTNFNAGSINNAGLLNGSVSCGTTAQPTLACSPTNNVITSNPSGVSSTFGQATATYDPRTIQYGIKFIF